MIKNVASYAGLSWLSASAIMAENQNKSTLDSAQQGSSRTLNMMVVSKRPLPVFDSTAGKITDVPPSLMDHPPTSLTFTHTGATAQSHLKQTKKSTFRCRLNTAFKITNYKGPEKIRLELSNTNNQKPNTRILKCDLNQFTNPLILIYPDPLTDRWNKPKTMVIDAKYSSDTLVSVVNLGKLSTKATFNNEKFHIDAEAHKTFRIDTLKTPQLHYRLVAHYGTQKALIANSKLPLKKSTHLFLVVYPSQRIIEQKIARPKLTVLPINTSIP